MNSEEERKIVERVKGLTIHEQRRYFHPEGMSIAEIGKLTADEFAVKVLFVEKGPDEWTDDEIRDALAYYLPNSCFARKRKRVDNVDVVGPSGGEVPKADVVEVTMETEEGEKVTRMPSLA